MSIVRWNNRRNTLPTSSNFFDELFINSPGLFGNAIHSTVPSVNISEDDKSFNVSLAAPGLSKSDFKINVHEDTLSISATKEEKKEDTKEKYSRKEFSYSSFKRSFTLPENVDSESIEAKYDNGVLELLIPKKEIVAVQPKTIDIN